MQEFEPREDNGVISKTVLIEAQKDAERFKAVPVGFAEFFATSARLTRERDLVVFLPIEKLTLGGEVAGARREAGIIET